MLHATLTIFNLKKIKTTDQVDKTDANLTSILKNIANEKRVKFA